MNEPAQPKIYIGGGYSYPATVVIVQQTYWCVVDAKMKTIKKFTNEDAALRFCANINK